MWAFSPQQRARMCCHAAHCIRILISLSLYFVTVFYQMKNYGISNCISRNTCFRLNKRKQEIVKLLSFT